MKVKSHREIFGTDFPLGGEWDACLPLAQAGKEQVLEHWSDGALEKWRDGAFLI